MTRPVPVAPMMADMVRNGITFVDGAVYENLEACPDCGGPVRPHDYREKRFATIADGTGVRDIRVRVKRFRCARCGRLCYADSPFYPDTRHGAPIVELAAVLSQRLPPGRTARTLARLGIVLDRATVRTYAALPLPPITTMDLFGIPVPVSIIQLSSARSGRAWPTGSPVVRGTPSRRVAPSKERQQRQNEDHEEERHAQEVEDSADRE